MMDMSIESKDNSAVSARAHLLWEQAGRPAQRDLEFWLEAEKQVGSLHGNPGAALEAGPTPPSSAPSQPLASKPGRRVVQQKGQLAQSRHKTNNYGMASAKVKNVA
jgi:hypothetical protein